MLLDRAPLPLGQWSRLWPARRLEGHRHHRADARHRHEPAAHLVVTNRSEQMRCRNRILAAQGGVHPQYRFHDTFKHRLAGGELTDAALEP